MNKAIIEIRYNGVLEIRVVPPDTAKLIKRIIDDEILSTVITDMIENDSTI